MRVEESPVQQPLVMLRLPQVTAMTGLPQSSVYALIAQNEFPKPVALSVNRVAWIEAEIQNWLRVRVEKARHSTSDASSPRGCRPRTAKRRQRPVRLTRADGRRIVRK